MSLVTRVLSNSSNPLLNPDGTPIVGVKVEFQLVDQTGKAIDVFDAISTEAIVGYVTTNTDANGLFSVNLWPNDRGALTTQYLCTVSVPGFQSFQSSLPSGVGAYPWITFWANGTVIQPQVIASLVGAQGPTGPAAFLVAEVEDDFLLTLPGPQGPQGNTGIAGQNFALDGQDGEDGQAGVPGRNGVDGRQGPVGPSISFEALEADEPLMIPGPPGPAGTSITPSLMAFLVAHG